MQVRPVRRGEEVQVLDLLKTMHAENGLASLNVNKVANHVEALIQRGWLLVAVDETGICGAVGLERDAWWYSDELRLIDRFLYVHPDCRRTGAGFMLVRAAKRTARQEGVPLCIELASEVETERKMRFFDRMGFERVGGAYIAREGT